MAANDSAGRLPLTGLSARLLVLTIGFVMLAELLIYAPSIGRYRLDYLQDRVDAAYLAGLAFRSPPDRATDRPLMAQLLAQARSHGIVLHRPAARLLIMTSDMPPEIAATHDLRRTRLFPSIAAAFAVLAGGGSRFVRVIDESPDDPAVVVETIVDEAPMRAAMREFSRRILLLSITISLITALLVYLSLRWLFVRPVLGIADSMLAFRADPEDARRVIAPGRRRDEIGRAQRELANMQVGLRNALQQRARLAALGAAMTRINHDLRNVLATAQLISDTLGRSDDPEVKRHAPKLLTAIDRAVRLCSQTLSYAHDGATTPQPTRFLLAPLVDEIGGGMPGAPHPATALENRVPTALIVAADRDQLFRALSNLIVNAVEAKAARVTVGAARDGDTIRIAVADDGPGLPRKVRENLFQPFAGSGRIGGSGLGLAIARELMRGHGGDVVLDDSGETGTRFSIVLPADTDRPPLSAFSESI